MPKDISSYNAAQSPEDKRICRALAAAIDAHFFGTRPLAGAECKLWHRHPVWFLEGNPIVGYHHLKGGRSGSACIRLLFWSGQSFDEPGLPSDPPGTRFKTAAARFASVDEIPARELRRWLKKSVAIQWDYRNIVKRRGKLERLK
ncbi:MAG: DUF1801 domain-containing protein [Phycisphaerales bacterium]